MSNSLIENLDNVNLNNLEFGAEVVLVKLVSKDYQEQRAIISKNFWHRYADLRVERLLNFAMEGIAGTKQFNAIFDELNQNVLTKVHINGNYNANRDVIAFDKVFSAEYPRQDLALVLENLRN